MERGARNGASFLFVRARYARPMRRARLWVIVTGIVGCGAAAVEETAPLDVTPHRWRDAHGG